ncbi:MAG: hypothetical protein R3C52_03855 [Hyphomonadaceae bacterium]
MTGFVSRMLERNLSGADLTPENADALAVHHAESIIAEDGVLDGNDDSRVVVANVESDPWRPFCCLHLAFPDGRHGIGSGLLVAPDLILTAAHNLYDLRSRRFVSAVHAHVGLHHNAPAASAAGVRVEVFPGSGHLPAYRSFAHDDRKRHVSDFGVIKLATTALFDWAGTCADLAAQPPMTDDEIRRSLLNVAGYPDDGRVLTLKTDAGPALAQSLEMTNFRYRMDTMPGQSGCPVFRYLTDHNEFLFAGVHVAGDGDANIARRFDPVMRGQLIRWKQALNCT